MITQSVLEKMALNERQLKAVMHVKTSLRITNTEYQQLTGAIRKTASRDLDDLMKKGLFVRKGARRGVYYVISGRLTMGQK
jgi:ATP-dependent DNA helicase RecG